MGVFNFMETFFFISLGITFVLILMLVYHFKQRLGTIEQKGDTMFEIVNTMVREMSLIKSMVISQMRENPIYAPTTSPLINEPVVSEVKTANTLDNNVSDDSGSDDDDSESDDSEGDESDDEDKIVVSDDEDDEKKKPLIKVINIPTLEPDHSLIDSEEMQADTIEITEEEVSEVESETNVDVEIEPVVLEEDPVLVVNKLPETESDKAADILEETVESTEIKETKDQDEVNYNKMSLYNLKNLVVSRGLTTDSSKMKKPQLIQLLETADK